MVCEVEDVEEEADFLLDGPEGSAGGEEAEIGLRRRKRLRLKWKVPRKWREWVELFQIESSMKRDDSARTGRFVQRKRRG